MKKKKNKKWVKFRHRVITSLAYLVIYPFVRLKYGAKIEKFKNKDKKQYLIVMNHQTDYDQFFVGCAFKGPVYYVASEDLFSNGFISKLLSYAVAPIPIKKQSTDVRAVMNCLKVAKEGGTIALAPEGNRTYSGKTQYINPAIAGLAKTLKLPIAFFKIENGYGVHPRWSDNTRRGKMRAYVSKVMQPEEFADMPNEQFFEIIKNELNVNEGKLSGEFYHKNSAEYLERVAYVCPRCGLSTFESHGDTVECLGCHLKVKYLPTKQLKSDWKDFKFEFFTQWYDYQEDFINDLNVNEFNEKPAYTERVSLFKVNLYKNKEKLESGAIVRLFGNRIELEGEKVYNFSFDEVLTVTVLGRNKLNIYTSNGLWQLKGSKRFNAIKYMHFFFRYNNIKKGEQDGKLLFLGL